MQQIEKESFVCVADAMVDTGLAKLGYEYINIGISRVFLPCPFLLHSFNLLVVQLRTETNRI
jgi:hypothetical protein